IDVYLYQYLYVYYYVYHLDLHSFPTRRSSDLQLDKQVSRGEITIAQIWRDQGFYERAISVIDRALGRLDLPEDSETIVRGYFALDRKSTRLNSSHVDISYAVFCLKKKIKHNIL